MININTYTVTYYMENLQANIFTYCTCLENIKIRSKKLCEHIGPVWSHNVKFVSFKIGIWLIDLIHGPNHGPNVLITCTVQHVC